MQIKERKKNDILKKLSLTKGKLVATEEKIDINYYSPTPEKILVIVNVIFFQNIF